MKPSYDSGAAPWNDDENDDENDDDSATTLGEESVNLLAPMPPKRQRAAHTPTASKKERGVRTPSSGGSRAPVLSPATQTLNTLSQHDAIGGGDLLYEISKKESDAATKNAPPTKESSAKKDKDKTSKNDGTDAPAKKAIDLTSIGAKPSSTKASNNEGQNKASRPKATPPPPSTVSPKNESLTLPKNANILQVSLSKPGLIGMMVALMSLSDGRESSIVRKVVDGSQAAQAGIQEGDILFRIDKSGRKLPILYDEVCKWPAHPRPIKFNVLRLPGIEKYSSLPAAPKSPSPTTEPVKSPPTKPAQKQQAVPTTPKQKTLGRQDNQDDPSKQKDHDDLETVPFCLKCNKSVKGRNNVFHHDLCPKHPRFYESGSDKKLDKLRRGVKAGCKACEWEWERGRKKFERHTCDRGIGNNQSQVQSPLTVTSPPQSPQRPALSRKGLPPLPECEPDSPETITETKSTLAKPDSPDTSPVSKPKKRKPAVPFCRACNQGGTSFHHALCPEHPHFDNSGADEKLAMIRRGVEVGCKACEFQYQNGKSDRYIRHSNICERRMTRSSNHKGLTKSTSKSKPAQKPGRPKKRGRPKKAVLKESDRDNRAGEKIRRKETTKVSKPAALDSEDVVTNMLAQPPKNKQSGKRKAGSDTAERTSAKKARNKNVNEKRGGCEGVESQTPPNGSNLEKSRSSGATPELGGDGSDSSALGRKQVTYAPTAGVEDEPIEQTNWVSCPNPWGVTGHVEGDVVLFCPSGGFTHHESIGPSNRFSLDPFGSQSNYLRSHRSPLDGYHVVRLIRDRMASHPWGFTFRRHDFGGACLVDSVDPLSPAAVAIHVGSPENTETRPSDGSAGLRVNDMILCINGKVVGGMTETGLSIELDVCGPELVMVVSRYKHKASALEHVAQEESSAWSAVDDSMNNNRLHDWTEIGAMEESLGHEVALAPEADNSLSQHEEVACTIDGPTVSGDQRADTTVAEDSAKAMPAVCNEEMSLVSSDNEASRESLDDAGDEVISINSTSKTKEATRDGSGSEDDEWADDDEPWLGCVCGKIHPKPIPVFWIQCDACDAWYSVSEDCVGFDEEKAKGIDSWSCWACSGPDTDDHGKISTSQCDINDAHELQQEDNTLSEYEQQRLKNIARNNARLEELGLLKKDGETAVRCRKKDMRKAATDTSLPKRRSTRTHAPGSSQSSSTSAQIQQASNSSPGAVLDEVRPQKHAKIVGESKVGNGSNMSEFFKPGTVVSVEKRTWPGVNKLGGVGKVLKVHVGEDGGVLYDVRYVLGGKERDIEAEYVTRHEFSFVS